MKLRLLKPAVFFQRPSPAQMRVLDHSEKLLEAFFSETPQPIFQRKITLTDQYLVISDKVGDDYEPSLLLLLTDTLTFQKLQHQYSPTAKTQPLHGFALINDQNQLTRIYLQFRPLSELWISRLVSCLNQVGFHDDYKLLDRIGRGSTSTVYKVQRISDGKILAAKVFLKNYLESKPQRKSSVFNEISLLRAMEHKNILKITEVYESSSAIYIISELLEGGTVFERINELKGFKPAQMKQIMKGIIQGLNYMHRFGIMHRDIKLENIMLRSKNSLEIVIVDFGLAAISQEQPYIFYRCGTPGYIAPQIIGMESNKRIDPICDVFSAGVILHILLNNRYLFQGKDNQQVYRNNKHADFDLEDERYASVDAEGMALLSQMLEVDPQERLSAEDVLSHQFFHELEQQSIKEKQLVSPAHTSAGEACYTL